MAGQKPEQQIELELHAKQSSSVNCMKKVKAYADAVNKKNGGKEDE